MDSELQKHILTYISFMLSSTIYLPSRFMHHMNRKNIPHGSSEKPQRWAHISRNLPVITALIVALATNSCSNSDKQPLPPVKIEEVKPAAKETHDTLRINLWHLGQVAYDNRKLIPTDLPWYTAHPSVRNYTILTDSAATYLARTPEYLWQDTPSVLPVITLDGESARFLSGDLLLVKKGENQSLYTTTNDSTLISSIGQVESFVSIDGEHASFGSATPIAEMSQAAPNSTVFVMKNGKKLFYMRERNCEIKDMSFEQIYKKKDRYVEGPDTPPKTLVLQTAKGQAVYDGWSKLTYFDDIAYGSDSDAYLMNKWSITNSEYYGARELIEAIQENNLYMNVPNPAYKEPVTQNTTLKDAVNNTGEPEVSPTIEKNVSSQFKNFKIKYIGVEYGEVESYYFSHDLKTFYYVHSSDNKEGEQPGKVMIYTRDYSVDEIVWPQKIPHDMQMNKIFTGDYTYHDRNKWKYLGEKKGLHNVEYTIQGAPGTYVQNGGEVKAILADDQRTKVEGYEFTGFLYTNEKGVVTPLTDSTPCPKDTKIILTFKKTAQKK